MFIEVHDAGGHPALICIDDIQRVSRGESGDTEIFMNEHEGAIAVRESVTAIKELILKVGGAVAASARVEAGPAPVRLQPVEGSWPPSQS